VEWIQNHYALLGLLLTAVGVIFAWLQLRKKEPAVTHIEDRSHKNSAVASGSGNMPIAIHSQGDVVFNHPLPSPAQLKPEKPEPRVPNIKFISAGTVSIEDHGRKLVECGSRRNAIVIRFRNEAKGTQTVGASVRALLVYKDGQNEIHSVKGFWIETQSNVYRCRVDDNLTVIAGLLVYGELVAYESQTHVFDRYASYQPDVNLLTGFEAGTLFIRLTDADIGHVLYEGEFMVTKNPLSIAPVKTA
jgi:hypothetical protein